MTKGGGGGGGGRGRGGRGRGGGAPPRGTITRIQGQIRDARARTRDASLTNSQRAGARRSLRNLQSRLADARAARG